MMIFSVDTHSHQCLTLLSQNDQLISCYLTTEANKHDKFLAEFTNRILLDNNLKVDNLKAISIVSGPGSFTGLRIGFAFVKGLVIEKNLNLIKITTTEIYAYQSKDIAQTLGKTKIISLVPSSSNKFYLQEFDIEAKPISTINLIDKNEITFDDKYLFVGNFDNPINNLHRKLFLDIINPNMLAKISYEKFLGNVFVEIDDFEPDYHFDFIPRTK